MTSEELTDEQKQWYDKQMGGRRVVKNNKNGSANVKKTEEIVHKYSSRGQGPLREAGFIAGIPYFIKKFFNEKRNEDIIIIDPYIEEATKILRPPFVEECPYIPYEFKTVEEPNQYLQRAKCESVDTLYQKIKSFFSLFNDVGEETLILLSADTLGSYFQDRYSTIHYVIITGDNGTGKSALGNTYECLGYRAVNITNATEAFWFRVFGTSESGQVTIIAEEFDRIDEKSQTMAMLKEGFHPNAKVPRMNNENTRMDFYLPFGFKIMIAERSPNENKAKGLIDRSLPIKTYKGLPKFDIKEIRNPQGNKQRQKRLEQIMDLRKLLLFFKILHFNDTLPEVDTGLNGRDKELCKPLLQLFYGLGASKETLNEIERALKYFLDIKNNRKEDSHEALVYPIIANVVSKIGIEVSTTTIWDSITSSIEGYFETYMDKESNVHVKNPNVFYTSDYGTLYRNSIIKMIRDKFGAEMRHKKTGNVFIFDPSHVARAGKTYGKTEAIQTKLVQYVNYNTEDESANDDSGEAGDAHLREIPESNSLVKQEIQAENSARNEREISGPLRKSESPKSPESPQAHSNANKKICPTCRYETEGYFMKYHQCQNVKQEFECHICKKNHKTRFKTKSRVEYENHMTIKHHGRDLDVVNSDQDVVNWD
jgi:hypothetical protein